MVSMDKAMDIKVDEYGTKYYETEESGEVRRIYVRHCFKTGQKHEPHMWRSYWFAVAPKYDNALCVGDTVREPYAKSNPYVKYGSTYTKTSTPKKDYSEDENFTVSDPITVTQARAIAYDMHKSQKDKSGEPYRLHLNAVEKGVVVLGGNDEERIAALFHDAVEDYHTSYELLRKINVTDRTLIMIEAVSKRVSEEQSSYLERIKFAGSNIPKSLADMGIEKDETASVGAARVKVADLLHNTRHDRIQALRDDKKGYVADRLLKKYRPALASLLIHLNLLVTETEQKELIATKPKGSATGSDWWGDTGSKTTVTPKKSSEPKQWRGAGIMAGDWIIDMNAPVLRLWEAHNETKTRDMLLTNGEVITLNNEDHYKAHAVATWWTDSSLFSEFSESDIELWHQQILDQRTDSSKGF